MVLGDRREAFYDSLVAAEFGPPLSREAIAIRIALDLTFTCDIFHQITACHLASFGLSRSTFNILILLHHGPEEGMQLHELGELLLVSRANVTGLIDHLEHKKLVVRIVDMADRRARFAKITATGSKLVNEISPLHNETVRVLLDDVSTEDKEVLIRLLKKVRNSLSAGSARMRGQAICKEEIISKNDSQ